MKNSVGDRSNAQVSCAGQFIANHMENFVAGPGAGGGRWLHIDMASPAHQGERLVVFLFFFFSFFFLFGFEDRFHFLCI